jgi:hypothetical protein
MRLRLSTELAGEIISTQSAKDALDKVARGKTNTSAKRLNLATHNARLAYEQHLMKLKAKLEQTLGIGALPIEKLDNLFKS